MKEGMNGEELNKALFVTTMGQAGVEECAPLLLRTGIAGTASKEEAELWKEGAIEGICAVQKI